MAQTPEQLQARLETSWANLGRIAREAPLTERCRQLLDKAKGLTQAMLLTLQFFITICQAKVEALNLPPEVEALMQSHLIPAIYLDRVAGRCAKAEERQRLRQLSQELLRPLRQADSPLALLDEAERRRLEEVATPRNAPTSSNAAVPPLKGATVNCRCTIMPGTDSATAS